MSDEQIVVISEDKPTVYVDTLQSAGWKIRGQYVQNCHLMVWPYDEAVLHRFAEGIGLKRAWFQPRPAPREYHSHYDLTPGMRARAVAMGAVEVRFELARVQFAEAVRRREP